MNQFSQGDKVYAAITKNGYRQDSYKGIVVGFTSNRGIKVKDRSDRVRCHAASNVTKRG
jgi:hypothetical protein